MSNASALKIAVYGAGGVGGYFGGRLAQHGADVAFIARGTHLEALRAHGLRVTAALGDFTVQPVRVTDNPAEVGPVDIVMVAVKLWDVPGVAEQIGPLLGAETGVISFQNGVDAESMLAERIGADHVLGGVAYITAGIAEPGRIEQQGSAARLLVGELDGRPSPRAAAFVELCQAAGLDTTLSADIEKDIWSKFVYLCGLSGCTTLMRSPIGPIREDPDTRALLAACLAEVAAVGRAKGVRLDPDIEHQQLAWADSVPATAKSSMFGDLERGSRLELPWLAGTIARLGDELGVPTPINHFIYTALKLHAGGRG